MSAKSSRSQRVAIVGGGISGISCSWKLKDHDCDVDIFEADDRIGGHANSVPFRGDDAKSVDVDTGFIAMDKTTYPQFSGFLEELGIEPIPTDMSFGISTTDRSFEWGSYSLRSFIGSIWNLFNPWFWRLMFDAVRFSLCARDLCLDEKLEATSKSKLQSGDIKDVEADFSTKDWEIPDLEIPPAESIGEYVKREGYSEQFINYFLVPMIAAPWCIDLDEFSNSFPAKKLIHFMHDHGLLDTVTNTLRWRSFKNGTKTYVTAYQKNMPARHKLHLNTPVHSVKKLKDGKVALQLPDGSTECYDHVVLAIHANQALSLLGDEATSIEQRMLSCFKTRKNVCYVHSETEFLPKRPSARVAWNCHLNTGSHTEALTTPEKTPLLEKTDNSAAAASSRISLTFDMNKLQAIPFPGEQGSPGRVLVTMNPAIPPRAPQSSQVYYHPLPDAASMQMAGHLDRINGVAGVSFAGAWMGFGFHEDGFAAGAHAASIIMHGREAVGHLNLVRGSDRSTWRRKGPLELALTFLVMLVQRMVLLISDWAW